ncbi:MAG: type II secretion system protein M [Marinospirillum sp.]|uniref:type II secretion system protein GspM n=1 Tax=Marinospirillum sp. TaxID=2183934 RepID=UPI001A07E797|nr:type II secretion system protein GspM [Marinospirillum sp.]MBE0505858.1 type II secretion system protein M [Marinospirillum sp.]
MITALKQRWSALQPSEQRLLKLASPIVMLMLLYLLAWQPLQSVLEQSSQQAERDELLLQRLEAVREQLQPVQPMDTRRWQALAASNGLQQVVVEEQAGIWLLQAQVPRIEHLERFLQRAADQGWHWGELTLQGQPLQLTVELLPL